MLAKGVNITCNQPVEQIVKALRRFAKRFSWAAEPEREPRRLHGAVRGALAPRCIIACEGELRGAQGLLCDWAERWR